LFLAKVGIMHIRKICRKSGNHSKEDLARSGYKPYVKHKTLIILLYFCLHTEKKFKKNLVVFFPSFLAIEKPLKSVHFQTSNLIFSFRRNFANNKTTLGLLHLYITYRSEQTAKRGKRHEEEEAESLAQANIRRVA
jgi:hypothetical protein